MRRLGGALAATAVAVGLFAGSAAAADDGLTAAGSVEQVQVTGATPGPLVSLLRDGERAATHTGGLARRVVFRHVEPGGGYAVSGSEHAEPVRVLTQRSAPPTTDVYDQTCPPTATAT